MARRKGEADRHTGNNQNQNQNQNRRGCGDTGHFRMAGTVAWWSPYDPAIPPLVRTRGTENLRPQKNLPTDPHGGIPRAERWKPARCPSAGECVRQTAVCPHNRTRCGRRGSEARMPAAAWAKPEDAKLGDTSRTRRPRAVPFPLCRMSRAGKSAETESGLAAAGVWVWRGETGCEVSGVTERSGVREWSWPHSLVDVPETTALQAPTG